MTTTYISNSSNTLAAIKKVITDREDNSFCHIDSDKAFPSMPLEWSQKEHPLTNLPLPLYPADRKYLKKLLREVSSKGTERIVLATTPNGTGDRLAGLVAKEVSGEHLSRVRIHNLADNDSITKALENSTPMTREAPRCARAFLRKWINDYVGLNLSKALELVLGLEGLALTPNSVLSLVRIARRLDCIGRKHCSAIGAWNRNNEEFSAKLILDEYSDGMMPEDIAMAHISSLASSEGQVVEVLRKKKRMRPLPPLCKDTLVHAARLYLNMAKDEVVIRAGRLYEAGLISSPDSSCSTIPPSLQAQYPDILSSLHPFQMHTVEVALQHFREAQFRASFFSEESDECGVIPTGKQPLIEIEEKDMDLYQLIALRFLDGLLPPPEWVETKAVISIEDHVFACQAVKYVVKPQWKTCLESTPKEVPMPFLLEGDSVTLNKVKKVCVKARMPYERAARIASVHDLDNLIESQLCAYKSAELTLTSKGRNVTEFLAQLSESSPAIFRLGREDLSNIVMEKFESDALIDSRAAFLNATQELDGLLKAILEDLKQKTSSTHPVHALGHCPECNEIVIEAQNLYHCSREGCPFKVFKETYGTSVTRIDVQSILESGSTGPKNCISKKGKPYKAALQWDPVEHKIHPVFNYDQIEICPACRKGVVVENEWSFCCSRINKGCSFSLKKDPKRSASGIDREGVLELLTHGKTSKPYLFTGKRGGEISAKVRLNEQNMPEFIYHPRKKRGKAVCFRTKEKE